MKPHHFDPLSFISGLAMLAFGLLFLIPRLPSDLIEYIGLTAAWFWPVVFIAIGAAFLVPAVAKMRKGQSEDS